MNIIEKIKESIYLKYGITISKKEIVMFFVVLVLGVILIILILRDPKTSLNISPPGLSMIKSRGSFNNNNFFKL